MTQQKPTLDGWEEQFMNSCCELSDMGVYVSFDKTEDFIRTLIAEAKEEGRTEERNRILEALPKKKDDYFETPTRLPREWSQRGQRHGYNECLDEVLKIINQQQ